MADADAPQSQPDDKPSAPPVATRPRKSRAARPRGTSQRRPDRSPTKPKQLPPYKVLLHNDDVNDMEYVIRTVIQLTALTLPLAVQCMFEAHKTGVALLLVTHKERAELYAEQFASKNLTVTIEPDEAE